MGPGNQMGGPMPGTAMNQMQRNPMGNQMRMENLMRQGRMNNPSQFMQFSRFPHNMNMRGPGGMRPPFFNQNSNDDDQMGDRDMRTQPMETKEWPPDDEVNDEDEQDDEPQDSDERLLPRLPPSIANIRAPMGSPLRHPRGPTMIHGPHGNPMLSTIPRAPSPNTAGMLPLRMMQPSQQPPMIAVPAGGPGAAAGFALAQGIVRAGMRIPMPNMDVRPGLVQTAVSQSLITPVSGGTLTVPGSVNGPVIPAGVTVSVPLSMGGQSSPPRSPSPEPGMRQSLSMAPDRNTSPMSLSSSRPGGGPIRLMPVSGASQPSSGTPILGRGFSPITIRPRGGPGLLGLRPGAPGTGGFNRFGGPRSLMGPRFGNFERPSFGNRFGAPLRPPLPAFFEEDKDERVLRKLDDQEGHGDQDSSSMQRDVDERQTEGQKSVSAPTLVDNSSKMTTRASGRPSRWSDGPAVERAPSDNSPKSQSSQNQNENSIGSSPPSANLCSAEEQNGGEGNPNQNENSDVANVGGQSQTEPTDVPMDSTNSAKNSVAQVLSLGNGTNLSSPPHKIVESLPTDSSGLYADMPPETVNESVNAGATYSVESACQSAEPVVQPQQEPELEGEMGDN